jgi:hypothetical protein
LQAGFQRSIPPSLRCICQKQTKQKAMTTKSNNIKHLFLKSPCGRPLPFPRLGNWQAQDWRRLIFTGRWGKVAKLFALQAVRTALTFPFLVFKKQKKSIEESTGMN